MPKYFVVTNEGMAKGIVKARSIKSAEKLADQHSEDMRITGMIKLHEVPFIQGTRMKRRIPGGNEPT